MGPADSHAPLDVTVVADEGSGRPFVILCEEGRAYREFGVQVGRALSQSTRVLTLTCPVVGSENWASLSEALLSVLRAQGIRQASFIALGGASALVQNLCLRELKIVRTLVLVDASSRAHPTRYTRFIDSAEKLLPLGLPFRHRDSGFDAKPYLQRIRCPALVVTTSAASEHVNAEADILEQRLPTSWRFSISGATQAEELARAVVEFQEVPARCPQKNLQRERSPQSA